MPGQSWKLPLLRYVPLPKFTSLHVMFRFELTEAISQSETTMDGDENEQFCRVVDQFLSCSCFLVRLAPDSSTGSLVLPAAVTSTDQLTEKICGLAALSSASAGSWNLPSIVYRIVHVSPVDLASIWRLAGSEDGSGGGELAERLTSVVHVLDDCTPLRALLWDLLLAGFYVGPLQWSGNGLQIEVFDFPEMGFMLSPATLAYLRANISILRVLTCLRSNATSVFLEMLFKRLPFSERSFTNSCDRSSSLRITHYWDPQRQDVLPMFLEKWSTIAKMAELGLLIERCFEADPLLRNYFSIELFSWEKLIVVYGENLSCFVAITWSKDEFRYRIEFGLAGPVYHDGCPQVNGLKAVKTELEQILNAGQPTLDTAEPVEESSGNDETGGPCEDDGYSAGGNRVSLSHLVGSILQFLQTIRLTSDLLCCLRTHVKWSVMTAVTEIIDLEPPSEIVNGIQVPLKDACGVRVLFYERFALDFHCRADSFVAISDVGAAAAARDASDANSIKTEKPLAGRKWRFRPLIGFHRYLSQFVTRLPPALKSCSNLQDYLSTLQNAGSSNRSMPVLLCREDLHRCLTADRSAITAGSLAMFLASNLWLQAAIGPLRKQWPVQIVEPHTNAGTVAATIRASLTVCHLSFDQFYSRMVLRVERTQNLFNSDQPYEYMTRYFSQRIFVRPFRVPMFQAFINFLTMPNVAIFEFIIKLIYNEHKFDFDAPPPHGKYRVQICWTYPSCSFISLNQIGATAVSQRFPLLMVLHVSSKVSGSSSSVAHELYLPLQIVATNDGSAQFKVPLEQSDPRLRNTYGIIQQYYSMAGARSLEPAFNFLMKSLNIAGDHGAADRGY